MRTSETIPSVVTWAEIKAHLRLDDDTERSYCEALAAAATEAFERETAFALGSRTLTVVYSADDLATDWSTLLLPKSPLISVTSITGDEGTTVAATDYEIRQVGRLYYVHLDTTPSRPITLVATVGNASVPTLAKQAVLIQVEQLYRNRGVTSGQQQYEIPQGLQRVYDLYRAKAHAG